MIHINTRDPINRQQLVLHPQAGLVSRATGGHPGDEDALVVTLEGGGAQTSSNAQAEALVGSAEADLVDELLGFNRLSRSGGVARR